MPVITIDTVRATADDVVDTRIELARMYGKATQMSEAFYGSGRSDAYNRAIFNQCAASMSEINNNIHDPWAVAFGHGSSAVEVHLSALVALHASTAGMDRLSHEGKNIMSIVIQMLEIVQAMQDLMDKDLVEAINE